MGKNELGILFKSLYIYVSLVYIEDFPGNSKSHACFFKVQQSAMELQLVGRIVQALLLRAKVLWFLAVGIYLRVEMQIIQHNLISVDVWHVCGGKA